MNRYKKVITMFFLLCASAGVARQTQTSKSLDYFDAMVDFAVPMSPTEEIRQDIAQALYAARKSDFARTISFLEDTVQKCGFRKVISEDDINQIQSYIDQINALIQQLESNQRSIIAELCQQIQGKLYH